MSIIPSSPCPTIGFDNAGAMHKVVGYLHDLGHRSFAMIAGITSNNDRARERLAGTREAIERKGLTLPESRVLERPYSLSGGRQGLAQLVTQSDRPTAVVCGNDVLAIGAILEAKARGLRVPEDISVTGFDDLDLAKEIPPGLTTVHAPLTEMGRLTAAYLLKAEPDGEKAPHMELPAELVVRGSTAPPA